MLTWLTEVMVAVDDGRAKRGFINSVSFSCVSHSFSIFCDRDKLLFEESPNSRDEGEDVARDGFSRLCIVIVILYR